MARDIGIGDEVAVTATVLKRISEDRASVSIPGYNFPHSIIDRNARKGQQLELTGDVTRIDDDAGTVTVDLGPLVTIGREHVRLVAKYRAPKRRTPLRDEAD